ncbi:MAG: AAA family ATPase, partial [Candidatus Paceibacterota bacterium]
MLILVCGLPGSGKTTLSQELSGRINGISLNTDSIREELFETRTYSKQEKEKVYEKLLECSQKNLENEKNVVVDATFYKKELREKFISLANKLGKKSYLIYCFLDEEKTKIRLQNRKNDKSEADFSVYLKIKRCFEPIQKNYLQINTSENIQKQIEQVLFYIMKEQLKEKYQLIETHISLIFLDDTFAYKIKKPVKFSFLDFSTKEKRKFYLNEELRLNKKISPAIYLGIVDVNFQKDKFLIGNGGQSFELALKMKKIDNKKKMDNLIQAGKISEKEIELLAKQISNFHQNAEIIKDFRYNSAQMLADQINDLGN